MKSIFYIFCSFFVPKCFLRQSILGSLYKLFVNRNIKQRAKPMRYKRSLIVAPFSVTFLMKRNRHKHIRSPARHNLSPESVQHIRIKVRILPLPFILKSVHRLFDFLRVREGGNASYEFMPLITTVRADLLRVVVELLAAHHAEGRNDITQALHTFRTRAAPLLHHSLAYWASVGVEQLSCTP